MLFLLKVKVSDRVLLFFIFVILGKGRSSLGYRFFICEMEMMGVFILWGCCKV